MSLKKERMLERGQYINDIDAFMNWNGINAFIVTEIKYASEGDEDRAKESLELLNELVNYIIKLENKVGWYTSNMVYK